MDNSMDSNEFPIHGEITENKLGLIFPLQMFSMVDELETDAPVVMEMVTNNHGKERTGVNIELEKTKTHVQCYMKAATENLVELLQQNNWYCRFDLKVSDDHELHNSFGGDNRAAVKKENTDDSNTLLGVLEELADTQIKREISNSNEVRNSSDVNIEIYEDKTHHEHPHSTKDELHWSDDDSNDVWKPVPKRKKRKNCVQPPSVSMKNISKTKHKKHNSKRAKINKTKITPKKNFNHDMEPIQHRLEMSRFQCVDCLMVRKDMDDLATHFKEDHKAAKNFIMKLVKIDNNDYELIKDRSSDQISCPYCYCERTKDTLVKHISNCHDMMPGYDKCISQMMNEVSNEQDLLPLHFMQEQECPECDIMFKEGNSLYKHFTSVHSNTTDFKEKIIKLDDLIDINMMKHADIPYSECTFCLRDRQGSAIFRHIYWCHTTNLSEVCDTLIMGKVRNRKTNRSRTLDPLMVQIGRNTCKYCMRICDSFSKKAKHVQSCEKNPNRKDCLVCRFCSLATPFADRMEEHMKKHLEKYVCEICAEQFQYKSSFYLHKRRSHGIGKPIKIHKCTICNKEFSTRSSYNKHSATHQENLYTCEYCGKGFKCNQSLAKHRNSIHLGIFPYHCDKCGYGLSGLTKLRKHTCGKIRNRTRDVGSATELRAKYLTGVIPKAKPDIQKHKRKVTGWRKKRVDSPERAEPNLYYPFNLKEFHDKMAEKELQKEPTIAETTSVEQRATGKPDVDDVPHKTVNAKNKKVTRANDKTVSDTSIEMPCQDSEPAMDINKDHYAAPNYCLNYIDPQPSVSHMEHVPATHHQHLTDWNAQNAQLSHVAHHQGHVTNSLNQQTMVHIPIDSNLMQPFSNMDQERLIRENPIINQLPYRFGHPQ